MSTNTLGTILQRGGEELLLEKVSDRFTIRPAKPLSAYELSAANWGNWRRSIPNGDLQLFAIDPEQLDQAMTTARSSPLVLFASHVYQIPNNPGTFVYLGDEITIEFASGVDAAQINSLTSRYGLILERAIPELDNTFVFRVGKSATENPVKIANRLQQEPLVLLAEPNIIIQQESHYTPREPLYREQWYLHHQGGSQLAVTSHIQAEKAWDVTRGVRSVVVAVVDDSFDLNHPDLQGKGKIVAPRDLKDNDFLPLPGERETSHGTACAGIAIAEENGEGIIGVAPGCALMPIRTTGYLDDASVEAIFDWAVEQGASVISCSWGASAVYFPLSLRQRAAITRAATKGRNGKGCVILFAAGNSNRPVNGSVNERNWPKNVLSGNTKWLSGFAIHPDVIAVSASTSLNQKAAYSNWGEEISVCAPSNNAPPGIWFQQTGFIYTQPAISASLPGLGMFTTDQIGAAGYDAGNFTRNFGGTSAATPVVAGVAALILSVNPDLTAQQVKSILQATADKIVDTQVDPQLGIKGGSYNVNGHSLWFGYGKVNAFAAVEAARNTRLSFPHRSLRPIKAENLNTVVIPDADPNGIKSPILMTDTGAVGDIQVRVDINHNFLGDLEIYLIAPNQQRVLIQARTLGRQTKLKRIYTTHQQPSLTQLLNQSAAGRWQLWIVDHAVNDVGTLNWWELTVSV